jgi:hypothetical protein
VHDVLAGLKAHARLARSAFRESASNAGDAAARRVTLGRTGVGVRVTDHGAGGLVFVSVHENEATAVRAARTLLQTHSGRLIELLAQGRRLVSFRIGLRAHTLDPNRIFTDDGLATTLRMLGPDSPAARAAGRTLRDALLAQLPAADGRPLVALHNNDGTRYSVGNFVSGGQLAGDASRVHFGDEPHPNEFFIVTSADLFDPLAADGFNVVQQSASATDDGSLSIWAQRAGRPYINVEAREGRLAEQLRMLEAVARHFGRPPR